MEQKLVNSGSIDVKSILDLFPIKRPFRFIDEIIVADIDNFQGKYYFRPDEYFFNGHFPNAPVVPGSIIQECAAQIGLVAFGMYLLGNGFADVIIDSDNRLPDKLKVVPDMKVNGYSIRFFLVNAEMKFRGVVLPGNTITVHSKKNMFRFNKLKCTIDIKNDNGEIVSSGIMSGMLYVTKDINN